MQPTSDVKHVAATTDGAAPRLASPDRAAVSRQRISSAQWQRFEGYLRDIFTALGMPACVTTAETPRRFLRALVEATSGYDDADQVYAVVPTQRLGGRDGWIGQVVDGPVPFFSLCAQHGLPYSGDAYIGYVAGERILGMSSLTQLVRIFARRFTAPDSLGRQVTDVLEHLLTPRGVAVHVQAVHLCTHVSGMPAADARTQTSCWRGSYETNPQLRAEFFRLCGLW